MKNDSTAPTIPLTFTIKSFLKSVIARPVSQQNSRPYLNPPLTIEPHAPPPITNAHSPVILRPIPTPLKISS
jgi:hypothetical protein